MGGGTMWSIAVQGPLGKSALPQVYTPYEGPNAADQSSRTGSWRKFKAIQFVLLYIRMHANEILILKFVLSI